MDESRCKSRHKSAMMIRSGSLPPLPRDTARAAEAVFGKGNAYLAIGDQFEQLLKDIDFACLESIGRPIFTRAVLTLVTIFQFAEGLTDRCALEAIRTRTEWKYALHLPLSYPGFEASALCRFRQIILADPAGREVFQQALDRVAQTELFRNLNAQQSKSDEVIAAVCAIACLEQLIEAMHAVLEALAAVEPRWLLTHSLPHWYERYDQMATMKALPTSRAEQLVLAQAIGKDAAHLLEAIAAAGGAVARLPESQALRHIWQQQFNQNLPETGWCLPRCVSCPGYYRFTDNLALH